LQSGETMTKASKAALLLASAAAVLLAGCFLAKVALGDYPIVHKTISVTLPQPGQQTNLSLSVDQPEVQRALKLIDDVMVTNGFPRNAKPIAAEDQTNGLVADYFVCGVVLKADRLEIGFLQEHRRRFSPRVESAIGQLRDKLASRYGSQRIKIESALHDEPLTKTS